MSTTSDPSEAELDGVVADLRAFATTHPELGRLMGTAAELIAWLRDENAWLESQLESLHYESME